MKVSFHVAFLLSCVVGCQCGTTQLKSTVKKPKKKPLMHIAIPQGSGEIFVGWSIYEIANDSLFVIDRNVRLGQTDADSMYSYDTLSRFKMRPDDIAELEKLISMTDSLGDHRPKGYYLPMGWPRFHIGVNKAGKELFGSVSNCYREHVFRFVDWLNKSNPKGTVIDYDIAELRELENVLVEKYKKK